MTRDDLSGLREQGFADADVLAICEVAAYYAYVNRIADGLGVHLEPELSGAGPDATPSPGDSS